MPGLPGVLDEGPKREAKQNQRHLPRKTEHATLPAMTFQIRLDVPLTFVTTLDIFWGDGFDSLSEGERRRNFSFNHSSSSAPAPHPCIGDSS